MEPSSSGRPTRSLPKQRSSAEFPHNERVRCPCRDDGGGEIVRFFARLDLGTAFATVIRQRHPMPSCGGLAPTAERTVDPARMIEESLTSDPGIREQLCATSMWRWWAAAKVASFWNDWRSTIGHAMSSRPYRQNCYSR